MVIDSFIIHHWIAVVVFQSNAVVSCLRIAHHVVNRISFTLRHHAWPSAATFKAPSHR